MWFTNSVLATSTDRRRDQFVIREKYQKIQIVKTPIELEGLDMTPL